MNPWFFGIVVWASYIGMVQTWIEEVIVHDDAD